MYSMKDQKVIDAICDLYKEGATIREVAEASGVSTPVIGSILKERGLTRSRGCRGRSEVPETTRPANETHNIAAITCHACGQSAHLRGAKFCCACGAELISPKERADLAIGRLLDYFEPYRGTKNMDQVLQDIDSVSEYIRASA